MCDEISKRAVTEVLDGNADQEEFLKNFNGSCYVPTLTSYLTMILYERIKQISNWNKHNKKYT